MKLSTQMQRNYNDTFMRNLSAISMSMKGVKADFKKLEEHRTQLQSEVDKNLERFRFMIADPDFNVNSPAQKLDLIYGRSEEHTSELQSLMRISYAVFCLKKKKTHITIQQPNN